MILREQPSDKFQIVGDCYVHGAGDGAAFLGQLPAPWTVQQYWDVNHEPNMCVFFNSHTNVLSVEDPRLERLPEHWDLLPPRNTMSDDPLVLQEYRNNVTGEVTTTDPRLTPAALRQRGVALQTFSLV